MYVVKKHLDNFQALQQIVLMKDGRYKRWMQGRSS
jgi:hypothetical protein